MFYCCPYDPSTVLFHCPKKTASGRPRKGHSRWLFLRLDISVSQPFRWARPQPNAVAAVSVSPNAGCSGTKGSVTGCNLKCDVNRACVSDVLRLNIFRRCRSLLTRDSSQTHPTPSKGSVRPPAFTVLIAGKQHEKRPNPPTTTTARNIHQRAWRQDEIQILELNRCKSRKCWLLALDRHKIDNWLWQTHYSRGTVECSTRIVLRPSRVVDVALRADSTRIHGLPHLR